MEEKPIQIYTMNDLIEILGVTRITIIKYIKQGKIKGFKLGNTWRVTKEALEEFIKESENQCNGRKT